MSEKVGDVAPQEEQLEYIGGRIFDADDDNRTIAFKGALIRISHPKAAEDTEPYLDLRNVTQKNYYTVPAGYEVEVIDGWVKLTKSAAS